MEQNLVKEWKPGLDSGVIILPEGSGGLSKYWRNSREHGNDCIV